jgi:translation initiation factor 5B
VHLQEKGDRKFACILAFDVSVNKEARELAESMGVRIFSADIIYHLFDQFTAYLKQVRRVPAKPYLDQARCASAEPYLKQVRCAPSRP